MGYEHGYTEAIQIIEPEPERDERGWYPGLRIGWPIEREHWEQLKKGDTFSSSASRDLVYDPDKNIPGTRRIEWIANSIPALNANGKGVADGNIGWTDCWRDIEIS